MKVLVTGSNGFVGRNLVWNLKEIRDGKNRIRPEIIRLVATIKKARKYFDCLLAHMGQNFDYNLNEIFFKDLGLAAPEISFNTVGSDLGALGREYRYGREF